MLIDSLSNTYKLSRNGKHFLLIAVNRVHRLLGPVSSPFYPSSNLSYFIYFLLFFSFSNTSAAMGKSLCTLLTLSHKVVYLIFFNKKYFEGILRPPQENSQKVSYRKILPCCVTHFTLMTKILGRDGEVNRKIFSRRDR